MPEASTTTTTTATDDTTTTTDGNTTTDHTTTTTDDEQLGDAGKTALAEERRRARVAERELKAAKAELEKARKDAMSESERAVAEAKEAGKREALGEANRKVAVAEIKALAAGRLKPIALKLLDPETFVNDDGDVDEPAVKRAIDKLLRDEPALALGGHVDLDGGARTTGTSRSMDDLIRDRMRR